MKFPWKETPVLYGEDAKPRYCMGKMLSGSTKK